MNFMNYPEKCLSQNAGQLPDSEFHVCRTKITRSSIVVIIQVMFFSYFSTAKVASRPGQCGRCDGYILEGKELEFYQRKLKTKKGK